MHTQFARIAGLFVVTLLFIFIAPVQAQSQDPTAQVAARELIDTIKLSDQFKTMLPFILKTLKPAIVQNRADVVHDFDAFQPVLLEKMGARVSALTDAVVLIYSSNFSAQELRELTAFYKTPTGQKFLQKTPIVTQQTMLAGQKFGQSAGADAQKQINEELRNKGHTL
jgi:hypothetical protein